MHTESGEPIEQARMIRLVDRARAAMNVLLITSALVIWGSWDSAPTQFASFYYERLLGLLDDTANLTNAKDFGSLLLPEARNAARMILDAADKSIDKARESEEFEKVSDLLDARIQLARSYRRMNESVDQQITVSAFELNPIEFLGFKVNSSSAGGLLSFATTGLLLYLISVTRTMRKYTIAESDWIFHLDGKLPVVLGGCWLLLPAVAVTIATGQLLWEILSSGILRIDTSFLFLFIRLTMGILVPLLLGIMTTWYAWKTRGNFGP